MAENEEVVAKSADQLMAEKIEADDFRHIGTPGLNRNPFIAPQIRTPMAKAGSITEQPGTAKERGVKNTNQPGSKVFTEDQTFDTGGNPGQSKHSIGGSAYEEFPHGHGEKKEKDKRKKENTDAIMDHEKAPATMGGAGQSKTKYSASGDRRLVNKSLLSTVDALGRASRSTDSEDLVEEFAKSQGSELEGVKKGKSRKKAVTSK